MQNEKLTMNVKFEKVLSNQAELYPIQFKRRKTEESKIKRGKLKQKLNKNIFHLGQLKGRNLTSLTNLN